MEKQLNEIDGEMKMCVSGGGAAGVSLDLTVYACLRTSWRHKCQLWAVCGLPTKLLAQPAADCFYLLDSWHAAWKWWPSMCHSNAMASQTPRTSALVDIRVNISQSCSTNSLLTLTGEEERHQNSVSKHYTVKSQTLAGSNAIVGPRECCFDLEKVELGNVFDEGVNYSDFFFTFIFEFKLVRIELDFVLQAKKEGKAKDFPKSNRFKVQQRQWYLNDVAPNVSDVWSGAALIHVLKKEASLPTK